MKLSPIIAVLALSLTSACMAPTVATMSQATPDRAPVGVRVSAGPTMGQALNAARAANGLPRLRHSRQLSAAAMDHARFMAQTGARTHAGSGGSTPGTRARSYGCNWTFIAENIAWGHQSDSGAMNFWMNSSGHRRNALDSRATLYGTAEYNRQRVMLVASRC